ncbi:serine hydrolase [Acidobacteria bacterium AH-259-A15]|nr:serine hydrolase [Acidobacteria bacterium AH-259-A15]
MNLRNTTGLVLTLMLACQPFSVFSAPDYSKQIEVFKQFVKEQMASDEIPGLSIGFIKDDFWWAEGFGYSDLENKVPAKAESAYRLASVTKPMTAIGVLKLAEQGKIDLDVEVQTYVPYFPKKKWPVTVRELLGHLAGISHYQDYDKEGHFKDHRNTREAIAVFEDFELVAEPGTRFNYSSYGYNLLGAVIEGASGKSYGDFMRESLWGPLGMVNTRMDDPNAIIPNRVRGYRRGPNGKIINSEFVDISSRFAAGGTRSTVIDLLKFAKGLMEGRVLPKDYVDRMFTSMVTKDGHGTGYGMGWTTTPVNGRFAVSHGGGQPETRTFLVYYPAANFAIAVASNFEGADRSRYVRRLYWLIMKEAYHPPAYTGARATNQIYRAMWESFNYGMSYFDRYDKPVSVDPEEVAKAFAYFNSCVDANVLQSSFEEAQHKITEGRHPSASQPFVLLGSFMSQKLEDHFGDDYVEPLHRRGAISFFEAYTKMYESDRNFPKTQRFDKPFEKLLRGWQKDWEKTWNEDTQCFALTRSSDFHELEKHLKKVFDKAKIYPDFVNRFSELVGILYLKGDLKKAAQVANMAVSLYPKSDQAHVMAGLVYLGSGDMEKASSLINAARELDVGKAASARALNNWAYQFKSLGQLKLGLALLAIARELYPNEANLYDSTGEFYLELGDRQQAIAYYEKALEIDPALENAKRMLEKIRQ